MKKLHLVLVVAHCMKRHIDRLVVADIPDSEGSGDEYGLFIGYYEDPELALLPEHVVHEFDYDRNIHMDMWTENDERSLMILGTLDNEEGGRYRFRILWGMHQFDPKIKPTYLYVPATRWERK